MIPYVCSLLSKNRDVYHSLVDFPGQHIYRNNRENTVYNRICSDQMDITAINFIKKTALMCFGAYSCVFSASYASFWMNNKTTTTSVKFPFVDVKSDAEFYLNLTLQWLILIHATFVGFGIEVMMNLIENFAKVSPKLIHLEFTEAIVMYEQKRLSEPQLRFAFKNALVRCLDYDRYTYFTPNNPFELIIMNFINSVRYLACVKEFQYWRTFITSFTYTYSIGMAIFCQFTVSIRIYMISFHFIFF